MAVSNLPIFPQSFQQIALANSLTTSISNVVVGTTNGSRVEELVIVSTDTIDHAITFMANVNDVLANVANVNIPAGSGATLGVLPVYLFANNQFSGLVQDAAGNKFMYLSNASCGLCWVSNSAVSSGKAVSIAGQASVF